MNCHWFINRKEELENEQQEYEQKLNEVAEDKMKVEEDANIFIIIKENISQIIDYIDV